MLFGLHTSILIKLNRLSVITILQIRINEQVIIINNLHFYKLKMFNFLTVQMHTVLLL